MRSGAASTVVSAVAASLPLTGSVPPTPTETVLLKRPAAAGAWIWIVMGGAAPTASAVRRHVTVPDVSEQLQPVPLAVWNATPAGNGSVTTTDVATSGPRLDTFTL